MVCFAGAAFLGQSATQRMTVIKLRDRSLWVHSPVALTEECEVELRRLGRVAHIVLPCTSPEHWYYGPNLIKAFPEALVTTHPSPCIVDPPIKGMIVVWFDVSFDGG